MYIWQLNIFRAKFEDEAFEEGVKGQRLYWKIEYGDNPEGPRGKEYTPTSKKKPTWNYWTQIRDSKDNNRLGAWWWWVLVGYLRVFSLDGRDGARETDHADGFSLSDPPHLSPPATPHGTASVPRRPFPRRPSHGVRLAVLVVTRQS